MNYEGIEVDMLSLGNADSILVTQWSAGRASRILIDGGKTSDADKVLSFLKKRGATYLDHIVCSHPHEDHAGGLLGIVQSKEIDFGHAWIHLPWKHIDQNVLMGALNKGAVTAKRVTNIIKASVQTSQDLVHAVIARGKPIAEPFQGTSIGFLFVCSPSQRFYEDLLRDFTDFEKLKSMEEAMVTYENQSIVEAIMEKQGLQASSSGLGQAPTEPENNSSTILWMNHADGGLLFTADAGVEALTIVKQSYAIGNLRWMQIPHHGSRRNVNEELIKYFKPKTAFVSADGTTKHPRRAVVNAFKAEGAEVFSTHYPNPTSLRFPLGTVPDRPDYSVATPLYDADKK